MRFWPQKTWKKIVLVLVLVAIAAFVAFGAFAGLLMSGMINRDVVSEVEVLHADGAKTALVVYQPGFTSFPRDVSYAFADGLASSGWRVEITTASPQAPSDFSKYSLLALAYPVYGGTLGTAIVSYVKRVSNLNGVDTVILACGGGNSSKIANPLKQQLLAANATFLDAWSLSNQDSSASMETARHSGSNIAP